MRYFILLFLVSLVADSYGLGAKRSRSFTLVASVNRHGALEPGGCDLTRYGGIEREQRAVSTWREKGENVVYVHAGSLFDAYPRGVPASTEWNERAKRVVEALATLEPAAVTLSATDLWAGKQTVQKLARSALFPIVSINIVDKSTRSPLLRTHVELALQDGRKWYLTGVSSPEPRPSSPGVEILPVRESLRAWLSSLGKGERNVLLLNDLPVAEHRALAREFPEIRLFVGASPEDWQRRIDVDPAFPYYLSIAPRGEGQYVAKVEITPHPGGRQLFDPSFQENYRRALPVLRGAVAETKSDPRRQDERKRLESDLRHAEYMSSPPSGAYVEYRWDILVLNHRWGSAASASLEPPGLLPTKFGGD